MAVTTTKEFLAICRKSSLLKDEHLAEIKKWTEKTDDPKRIAAELAKREWVSRWQAQQLLNGRANLTMGKYQLIDLLGRRGMGNVFIAQHTTMNRRVALKIVSKRIGQDPQLLERFLAEARAIATLDDENIVRAYSVDKENDCYYIVLEYVEGRDLQDIVREEGPLDTEAAAAYLRQAAEGLAHAHEHGLIHGDIKPSSLLVSNEGVLKITDVGMSEFTFGSKSESGEQKALEPKAVDYMAPELTGDDPQPDPRSDIYSLGCTLYFLLTGEPPFPKGTVLERMKKHRSETPEPITKKRPDVSKNLARVCTKMMAKDPEGRFRSADVVQKVLAEVIRMEQDGRKRAADEAAPPPPRDAEAPAVAGGGKGNGEAPAAKKPAEKGQKKRVAAAVADGDEAPAKAKQASPAKKTKRGEKSDWKFLDGSAEESVDATPVIAVGKKKKKAAAPAAAAGAVAVAPATKGRTKAKAAAPTAAAKAAPAPAETEAAVPAPAPTTKGSFFTRNKKWILIGGAAALVLVALGAGIPLTIWAMSSNSDDEKTAVASDDDAAVEPADTGNDEGTDPHDEGSDPFDEGSDPNDEGVDPVDGDADDGADDGTGAAGENNPAGTDEVAMGTTDGGTGNGGTGDGGTTTNGGGNDSSSGGTSGNGGSTDASPNGSGDDSDSGDDTSDGPDSGDGSNGEKEPTTPPDDKKPDDKKPDDKKPTPPPKPKDPFQNFKPVTKLLAASEEGGAEPQKLAAVDVAEDAIWFVSLLGGKEIAKGKQLKLEANGEDGHKSRWTLDLETEGAGQREGTTVQVGELWYEGGNLVFQWSQDSGEVPDAAMQSCLLQIDLEEDGRSLRLMEPRMVEPIVIDFQKKPLPIRIDFEPVPDPDLLKLEVTRVEGIKDKMSLNPNEPVPEKTPVNVQIMLTDAFNNVVPGAAFEVSLTTTRKGLTINNRLAGSVASHPAIRASLSQMRATFPLTPDARNSVAGKIKELEAMMKGKQGQGLKGDKRAQVQEGIRMAGMALWFDDFIKAANGVGKIHYRVFMDVEGRQVDIVRTEPPQPQKGGKKGGGKAAGGGGFNPF